jgi:prepilin peptidase CpaA
MDGGIITGLALVLAALLAKAAWSDIKSRTISNRLNAAIALLAPLWWWALGLPFWPDIAVQLMLAAALLVLLAGLFALGAMGGGDVKLIVALALWLRPTWLASMLLAMAIAGGVLTLGMLVHHRWTRKTGQPEVPYGVAISAAGLLVITNDILTISGT